MQTDAVSSSGYLLDSASLQRDIHRHLLSLGFSKNGSGYFVDGELSKQKIRNLHAAQRLGILEQRRAFVETHGSELAEHFASGNQVDPVLIDPELVEVRPESLDSRLFRFASLLWSVPVSQGFGRRLRFLVRDRQNGLADRLVKPGGRISLVLPVTALFGESWREIRQMLASRYEVEFVVSSHDPNLLSMSYDTAIAKALLVARRLVDAEDPTGRGRFVNLQRAPYSETDALALVRALNTAASIPLHRSDGPPVDGSPLMVGGEQWGEIVDGPQGNAREPCHA